jgi:hypothetical protein
MTRSRERGENEVTREAQRRAIKQGRTVCDILAEMLREAQAARDQPLIAKIREAQKFAGCRNIRRRRSN